MRNIKQIRNPKSEYGFTVAPNKNGMNGLNQLNGIDGFASLNPSYPLGPVKFTKPIAYQEIEGKRVEVEAKYVIRDRETSSVKDPKNTDTDNGHASRIYGFAVASYDKTKDLIINPLLESTYLVGSDRDDGYSLTLDTSGNVYVTGWTVSGDFPTTSGAYDTSHNGYEDVFVSKLDGNLSAADTTPPTVVSTSPGSNAVGVAVDSVIAGAFSEEMDASTINTSTFYLNGGVTGTVSYDKSTKTAKFTPYSNLSNATTYTATITTGVKDLAGNNMSSDYSWSFTTIEAACTAESIAATPAKLTLNPSSTNLS